MAEEGDVQHRTLLPPLDDDEGGKQDGAADQRPENERARPAVGVSAKKSEDDQEERGREDRESGHVRAPGALVTGFRDALQADEEGEDSNRDVHEEDPAPAERVGENAADQRP